MFVFVIVLIVVAIIIYAIFEKHKQRKRYLAMVLHYIDKPTINVFNISRDIAFKDPYSLKVIKKFNDFVLLSDFNPDALHSYQAPSSLDFDEGNIYIITESLKKALEFHKFFYNRNVLDRIKEEYMITYTGKTDRYDIKFEGNNHDYKNKIESNYPLPIDWNEIRQKVIERDKNCCILCGDKLDGQKLQVHHIKYRKHGGSHHTENLVSLCEYCHASLPQHEHASFNLSKEIFYYVNVKTKIIHYKDCRYASSGDIKQLTNYDVLISQGYKPCGYCEKHKFMRSLGLRRNTSFKKYEPLDLTPHNKKIILNIYKQRPDLLNKVLLSNNPVKDVLDKRYFSLIEENLLKALNLE